MPLLGLLRPSIVALKYTSGMPIQVVWTCCGYLLARMWFVALDFHRITCPFRVDAGKDIDLSIDIYHRDCVFSLDPSHEGMDLEPIIHHWMDALCPAHRRVTSTSKTTKRWI